MKKIFPVLLVVIVAFSCKSKTGDDTSDDLDDKGKNVTSRDLSITAANAYSDLFLDSTDVSAFINSSNLSDKEKRRLLSFYNSRNYQYAWFLTDGLTEHAMGFYNIYLFDAKHNTDSLTIDKKLKRQMDDLFASEHLTISTNNQLIRETELRLSKLFIQHGLDVYEDGYVKRKEMERFVPSKKEDVLHIADSLLNKKHKDNKYFEDINEPYKLLKIELGRFVQIEKNGGWPTIITSKKIIKKGTNAPVISIIKKRLAITGDLPSADTSTVFNDSLLNAVKAFQNKYGLTPSGTINQQLVQLMNIPVKQKIKQLLINLYRMRWMPSLPDGDMILVNIPEFVLHVMKGKNNVWDMNVVVGKEGHNTLMFTDDLDQVVFSPYWNLPPSIVINEILPKMKTNPNYLASQNFEIVKDGELPEIRQLPGPKNSLGKVKFLFPNSFNIYFHDTNAKSLFNKDQRAYSHGCIRLSNPQKMAEYLLHDKPEWTPKAIKTAMNASTEKTVKLKKSVPVFITYYTAWVDERGNLNFRDDIYGHDKKLQQKMFLN